MFGRLEQEEKIGSINIGTGPWVRLLIQDLQFLMEATHSWIDSDGEKDYNMDYFNIEEMVEGSSTGNRMRIEVMEWILDADISEFDSYEDVCVRIERTQGTTSENDPNYDQKGNPLKCPLCDFVGRDYQRTRAHFQTYDTDILVKTVLTNQCPVCEKTSTDTLCARQHAKRLQKTKHVLLRTELDQINSTPSVLRKLKKTRVAFVEELFSDTKKSENIVRNIYLNM